jgi:uracil-DNA glycosylase
LKDWAKQGVLMLNTVLTVRSGMAASHRNFGWEKFTDHVIEKLNAKQTPVIFLLWGKPAAEKAKIITNPIHLKLEAPHPSPLSAHRGFFGCKHFSKANKFLADNGIEPINWQIK